MNKITVLVHIDALRHDYITPQDMPFLYSLAQIGFHARLIPPFGFEPDGAYWTGSYPEAYEGGMHFVFTSERSSIPNVTCIPAIADHLNIYAQYPIRKGFEWALKKWGETARIRQQPYIGQIPFKFLKYFDFGEKYYPFESGFARGLSTVFDRLRKENLAFFVHGAPQFAADAESTKQRVLREFKGTEAFAFLFIDDLDRIGHQYGPNSTQRSRVATIVDQNLEQIYRRLSDVYDNIDIICFGDHGMVEINEYLDLTPFLNSLSLKPGKDFIYFLDSTFARFWHLNAKAEKELTKAIVKINQGQVITAEDRADYHINYQNRKFGDITFWLDPHVMIFPNFWHVRNKKRGMHGYRSEVIDNHAAFVFHSSAQQAPAKCTSVEMVDVFQTTYYSLFGKNCNLPHVHGKPVQIARC